MRISDLSSDVCSSDLLFSGDTFAMFTTENALVAFVINMFEDILIIHFAGGRFIATRVIADMKRSNIIPASIYIGNDVTFRYLLVVHVVHVLSALMVHGYENHPGLGHVGKESPRKIRH